MEQNRFFSSKKCFVFTATQVVHIPVVCSFRDGRYYRTLELVFGTRVFSERIRRLSDDEIPSCGFGDNLSAGAYRARGSMRFADACLKAVQGAQPCKLPYHFVGYRSNGKFSLRSVISVSAG